MVRPKIRPCPECGCIYTELYGYGEWGTTWHVECDECHYMGPGGNKLQAIRQHNARLPLPATSSPDAGEQKGVER